MPETPLLTIPALEGTHRPIGWTVVVRADHGTRRAYLHCLRRPEGPCDACRAANARFVAQYRRAKERG
jgi:hypothetical protein